MEMKRPEPLHSNKSYNVLDNRPEQQLVVGAWRLFFVHAFLAPRNSSVNNGRIA